LTPEKARLRWGRHGILADHRHRHCGTGIWPDRDIAAGWRAIETRGASLPTRAPSQPRTPARKAGVLDFESGCGRETDSPLEEAGFEPSVPRYGELGWRAVSLDIRRGMSLAEKVGEFGAIHLGRSHREGAVVDRAEAAA
jgi:hypothetical protein